MMKTVFILTLLFASLGSASQVVQVIMEPSAIRKGNEATFQIRCASEQDLEVVVFAENQLVLHQNSTLTPGDNSFKFPTHDLPKSKYFILVTGNGIHVEKEFLIVD